MTRKIIRNYQLFKLIEGLSISFFFGTYQLFLSSKGMSLLEINLINAVFMVANFIFEIPTGAIADFLGRKRSVIIGLWIYSLSFLAYFFADRLWHFLLAEIIGALAATCISGALEAMVVDSLYLHGYSASLEKIFRRAEIRNGGIILGAVSGALAGQADLARPWLMSAVCFALLAIAASYLFRLMPDWQKRNVRFSFAPLRRIAQESIAYGVNNRRLMTAISFAAILAFAVQAVNMYWPLVFRDSFGVEIKYMGLIFGGIIALNFLGSQLSHFWQKIWGEGSRGLFLSQAVTAAAMLGCCFISGLPMFLTFFLLHEAGRGLFNPLNRAFINASIEGKNRATILSFESMVVKAGAALGLLGSGLLAGQAGILFVWGLSAAALGLAIVLFWHR